MTVRTRSFGLRRRRDYGAWEGGVARVYGTRKKAWTVGPAGKTRTLVRAHGFARLSESVT